MDSSSISLSNINVSYGDGSRGLVDATLTLERGKKTVILGENGAGKSTLFKVLVRLLTEHSGTYLYAGKPAPIKGKELEELRRNIGLVFQEPDIQIIENTVFDEVAYGAINAKMETEEIYRAVDIALDRVDMLDAKEKATHHLSGGQKKRVTIASVLVCNPTFLLFDEPTASLDPQHSLEVEHLLDDLSKEGKGVVVSTHDVDFALRFADEIILMEEGEVLFQGDPATALSNKELIETCSLTLPMVFKTLDEAGYNLSWLCKEGYLPLDAAGLSVYVAPPLPDGQVPPEARKHD